FTRAEADRYVEAMAREGAARSAINYYRAAMRRTVTKPLRFARIDAPTLVIWGEKDHYLGRDLATPDPERVPHARVERVPRATHWVQHDAPERVNELLLEFIGDLRIGGRPS